MLQNVIGKKVANTICEVQSQLLTQFFKSLFDCGKNLFEWADSAWVVAEGRWIQFQLLVHPKARPSTC
jgi:hypothetical protein